MSIVPTTIIGERLTYNMESSPTIIVSDDDGGAGVEPKFVLC